MTGMSGEKKESWQNQQHGRIPMEHTHSQADKLVLVFFHFLIEHRTTTTIEVVAAAALIESLGRHTKHAQLANGSALSLGDKR